MTGSKKQLAARLHVMVGLTPTVPRLPCLLVALGAAETDVSAGPDVGAGAGAGAGAYAGGSDDSSGVTPPGEIVAGEVPLGEVTPGEAC